MKILVIGARGQLGSDLVPLIEKAGFEALPYASSALDITDREKVIAEAARTKPDVIVNCAAYTKVDLAENEKDRAFAVNGDGPKNLALAAKAAGSALIHVSTDFVFDGSKPSPYAETDGTNPLSVYGQSKLRGELEVARNLQRHFIVRTSWLYGVSGHNFVKTIIKYGAEREVLKVVYDQAGTPTWSFDLASALMDIIKAEGNGRGGYGIYHYSNEGVASWYDFAELILEEARRKGVHLKCSRIEPILTAEYPTPARRPAYSVFDKKKIKETFGITIPHWRVSLRKMLNELYGGGHA